MPTPTRAWNAPPVDPTSPDSLSSWMNWATKAIQQAQAPLFPPQTPVLTTIPQPNAVQLVWNEVSGASSYACFEMATASAPPGVPFTTVPANVGARSNSVLRSSINDTVTRYYSVQAISPNSRSQVSSPIAGTALSGASTISPISQTPVNQGGVGGGVGGGGGLIGIKTSLQTQ
jgi:hypothetical protein